MKNRFWLYGVLAFALLGAVDAGYLSSVALSGDPLACNFIKGCEAVAMSSYSRVLGVPLSVFGLLFYLTAVGIVIFIFNKPSGFARTLLLTVSGLGVAASLYFTYLQAFVIQAWCEYCIFSAVTSLLVFVSAYMYVMDNRSDLRQPPAAV